MAIRTTEEMPAFIKALCDEYKVPDIQALVKLKEYTDAFAETKDPQAAAEVLNRRRIKGGSLPAWFIRGCRLETYLKDKNEWRDDGPAVEVLLPNGRTRKLEYAGDTSTYRPLKSTVRIHGVTLLRKVYEKTLDWTGIDDGDVKFEEHSDPLPAIDVAWVFEDGTGPDKKLGPIFKVEKNGCIRGDSGDDLIVGSYTIVADGDRDIRVSDGKFDKKGRTHVQALAVSPSGAKVKAKFYNVRELGAKFGLDENCKADEWADVLRGRQFIAGGKIGVMHPRKPADFERPGTPQSEWHVFSDKIAELTAAGAISITTSKKGKSYGQLDLSKVPAFKNERGEEVRPTYVNIGQFRVYKLEKKGESDWQASVLATDVGGVPWLSLTEGEQPADENGKQFNPGAFCVWLDSVAPKADPSNPFFQAMNQASLKGA